MTLSPSSRPLRDDCCGRYREEDIATEKWIIFAAASNHAEDLTRGTTMVEDEWDTQLANEWAADVHSYSYCLRQRKSHTNQKQAGSITIMVDSLGTVVQQGFVVPEQMKQI